MTKKRENTRLDHPIWSHVAIIKYQLVFQFFEIMFSTRYGNLFYIRNGC